VNKQRIPAFVLTGLLAVSTVFASTLPSASPEQALSNKVRHELITLPFYGVFDQLSYQLEGRKVILSGQVTRPTLQSSAANVVKAIPGVEEVVNNIEVLPLSPNDDRIRIAVFRTLYSQPQLSRYSLGAIPQIHIIVKNGNVTLSGVVINEMDKNIANIYANQVNGVFAVTNNLVVEKKS
jgi:hyperosmotically inducible periplasmic protein